MQKEDKHSGNMIRCEACGTAVPAYDVVSYGSIEDGYRQLCSQCFNAEVASTQGLERFENLRFDQVAMTDCAGEAGNVLSEIDLDQSAENVFFVLDSVDVQDCWNRAGNSRDGYTSPDEAAFELIEEQLQPFFDQAGRSHALGMTEEAVTSCRGVILGIYRYQHESKSEFREWSVDIPIECAGDLLSRWRERGRNSAPNTAMDAFIRDRCPNWARYFLRTGGRS